VVATSIVARVRFGSQGGNCDPSQKADAGRASASQLRSEHGPCLYPRHRGFREVLPPFARWPRPRTYSRVPGSPVSRLQTLSGSIEVRTAALRFLFVKTLRRPYLPDHIPFPKRQRRMPIVSWCVLHVRDCSQRAKSETLELRRRYAMGRTEWGSLHSLLRSCKYCWKHS